MATIQSKWISITLDDPWAQRLVGGGICVLGLAVAATVHKNGGFKIILEGGKMVAPKLVEHVAKNVIAI